MSQSNPVCIWPNGDWCWGALLEDYGRDKSDDYLTVCVPEWTDEEDVENIAQIVNSNPTSDPMPLIAKYFGL